MGFSCALVLDSGIKIESSHSIKVKRVCIRDGNTSHSRKETIAKLKVLKEAADELRLLLESSQRGLVLLCCKGGLNRSVAVCLAYGIYHLKLEINDCYDKICESVRAQDRHCEYLGGQCLLLDDALQVSCFTLRVCSFMTLATLYVCMWGPIWCNLVLFGATWSYLVVLGPIW